MPGQETYRLTLFKIPDEGNQQKLLKMYEAMPEKARKVRLKLDTAQVETDKADVDSQDGKPYIVSVKAGKSCADARNQGYTVAVTSTFASMEDFVYYDTRCEAHGELRAFAKTVHQGNMMVFYQAAF
jgi:predicted RecB family endonuclease